MIEFYGGYQVYDENGIDLTTLRRNLTRTPEERLENNSRAAVFFDALRRSAHTGSTETSNRRPFMLDVPTLLRVLTEHKVEFVVIGGVAMVAHGSNHATLDLDVCYNRAPENLAALSAALTSLQAYLRGAPKGLPFKTDVPTLQVGLNFTLETAGGDLDVLGEVSGVGSYAQALARSEEKELFGHRVPVLSLDGLIAAKKAAGRNKDRSHLLELEALKKLSEAPPQE